MTDAARMRGEAVPEPGREAERELPADRIFLTDYVHEMEIGAYREEFGVRQRVAFDVTVEVSRNTAHLDDRVERVMNYDTIVRAIAELAEGPRIQLLETLAERLAERILSDPRAHRAHLRIAKLDRLGAGARLGIEITRQRAPMPGGPVLTLPTEPG
ncbi:MAG: dihydroneopterin aldolase [Pseudomonadota bacterium]